jgi:hypothetical protein
MAPTITDNTLKVGEWVAMVGDDIVGRGNTEEEALEDAWNAGFRNVTLARVAEPGTHVI